MTIFVAISTTGSAIFAGVGPVLRAATNAWISVLVFRVVCVVVCDGCVLIALEEDFLRDPTVVTCVSARALVSLETSLGAVSSCLAIVHASAKLSALSFVSSSR